MGGSGHRIRAEKVDGGVAPPSPITDADVVAGYLEDASGMTDGRAAGVHRVRSEAEAAALIRATGTEGVSILAQGARSSLTGGGVPRGDLVLTFEGMDDVRRISHDDAGGGTAVAGPGIPLDKLQEHVRREGLDYPPIPTHRQASLGGTVSTNAGGPATFKYGVTRDWIRRVRGILACGDVIDVARGEIVVPAGSCASIALTDGSVIEVPVPSAYRTPTLRKVSTGYFVADETDFVDLLVGSEGTLLVLTEIEVNLTPCPAGELAGLLFCADEHAALAVTGALRAASKRTWRETDPHGLDIRAIEFMDANCLRLIRERGVLGDLRLDIPEGVGAVVFFEMEMAEPVGSEAGLDLLARHLDGEALPDGPTSRLFRLLGEHVSVDAMELAFPGDDIQRRKFVGLREAAPESVNELMASRRSAGQAVRKIGGDAIVPFDALEGALTAYHDAFARRGVAHAIWGHVSDGNLHPNALPESPEEAARAADAQREVAAIAKECGGSPLSEHGVGRSPLKQSLLLDFYGAPAIEEMRAVKRAFDPAWRLAPGVLFPREGVES
jgi:D-lactate dehydrogenase (cytochrome)